MDPVFNDTSSYNKRSLYNQVRAHDGWLDGGGPRQNQSAGGFHEQHRATQNDITIAATCNSLTSGAEDSNNSRYSLSDPSYADVAPVSPVSQGVATDEVDSTTQLPNRLDAENKVEGHNTGVNFQNVLDNLSQPSSGVAAPSNGAMFLAENSSLHKAPTDEPFFTQGLPARRCPAPAPLYAANDEAKYNPPAHESNTAYYTVQPSNAPQNQSLPYSIAPGMASSVNTLPPPPTASFQTRSTASESQVFSQNPAQAPKKGRVDKQGRPIKSTDDDSPWGPEVQKKYDEFLHDERMFVTEGLRGRFPMESRLFVGNLPTERVTKRDMFHIFHKYGKLAQVSIKQAYGFIQFLEASSCHAALGVEQGTTVRGRKIHLEISKPQRSTRPAPAPEPSPAPSPRRSPSHEFSQAPARSTTRVSGDRYDRSYEPSRLPFSGFRDEPSHRRHDDRRLPRSPSPRPFRRCGYWSRDGTPERVERRRCSRSPRSPRSSYFKDQRYRSVSPRARGIYEGEANLSVPRRVPRDVPEVQLLVLEELDRNFILLVENAFRNRGLRVDVLVLGPRIPLGAAVHRQFIEGVLAVVRLSRPNQLSRKISLQLFDRTAGSDNVRFLHYPELEPNRSAELLGHQAQAMQQGAALAVFAPNPAFGIPAVPPMSIPQPGLPALSNPHNIANLIDSLDGPSLSFLLSARQRSSHSQPVSATQSLSATPNPPPPADLAGLLTYATRPSPISTTTQQLFPPFNLQPPNAPVTHPSLFSLQAKGLGGQQPQGQGPSSSQVQNLMHHLAKRKQ